MAVLMDFIDELLQHVLSFFLADVLKNPGGVLPYVTLTGTCGPIGYGFQGVLS